MKKQLERMIQAALRQLLDQEELIAMPAFIQIDATKEKEFGDFATNVALVLAKTTHHAPYVIAERIVAALPTSPLIEKVDIRQPGFINFFLAPAAYQGLLAAILSDKNEYGRCKIGRSKKVLVEFVSAPPVKPLHQDHARLAVFGKAVARLLDAIGFQVATEFYIDDVVLSVHLFSIEVWRIYLELLAKEMTARESEESAFAEEIAFILREQVGEQFYLQGVDRARLLSDHQGSEGLIAYAQSKLGDAFQVLESTVTRIVIEQQRADLDAFDIKFDSWVDAKTLLDVKTLETVLQRLKAKELLYEKDGGCWFRSQQFGDERDRVLIRPNGDYTHLAYDLAYHLNKFERGFDIAIDIFDFNPVDYAAGIQAGLQALGYDPEQLMAFYVQPVHIMKEDESIHVPLRVLQAICPKDELYFQLLIKRACQPIDFGFDTLPSGDHPLSYIQYAAVRIQTIFSEMTARGFSFKEADGLAAIHRLVLSEERALLNTLALYSETLIHAALSYEPHLIVHYLRTLAAEFHPYYNASTFLVEDVDLRSARLTLIMAVRQLLWNGCALLGVSLPETM